MLTERALLAAQDTLAHVCAAEDAGWRETVAAAMREEQARNDSLLLTERYPAEVDREAIVIPQPEGLFE